MAEVFLKRAPLRPVLEPMDDAGLDLVRSLPGGTVVRTTITRPRSLPHLRWFWALCELIAVHNDCDSDDIADKLKIATGHCVEIKMRDAKCPHCAGAVPRVSYKPKSIAFHKMDEQAFRAFTDRCVHVVVTRIMPGMDSDILRAEIEAMLS